MASPGTNLFEIEQAFRDNASAAYLVATTEGFVVVLQCDGNAGGGQQSGHDG
jgi:hypothetical protein